jgi:pimeloyl-ACP methyl ester carboxylesterase
MEKAKLTSIDLEYDSTGSGEPVLLISMGPIADSFLPFASETSLADRYRLIRYRQRRIAVGTGEPTPVSFAQHAADAAALLEYLGIRSAHVAGHSTGGAVALQMAVDRPDMVHTLALLEPTLPGAAGASAFFAKAGPALAAYGSGDRAGAMALFLSAGFSLDWETCRRQVEMHVPGGVARAIDDADNFFRSYLPALSAWQFGREQAAIISQPVLSVLGTDSEQWFADAHELLHAWLPQVEDCVVDGVAHLLHLQRPKPVMRCVADFFARHAMGDMPRSRQRSRGKQ